ncbi:MAG: hypothetical protein O7D91_04985 [Planctomycetota bacterium]|nr:hypothetical protein [Planctomycetota bacterium]
MLMDTTTVTVNRKVKARLERLKLHPRESYDSVIKRLLPGSSGDRNIDADSISETIAILSDPETMRSLARSLEDVKEGRVYALDEV